MNKKRPKQTSKEKRISLELKNAQLAVFLAKSTKKAKIIHTTSLLFQNPNQTLADKFVNYRHHWKYRMFILCRDQRGEQYIILSDEPSFKFDGLKGVPFKQPDIANELDAAHHKFLKDCNQMHVLNTGWLAFPYHHDYTEDELLAMIDGLCDINQCWDYNTKWEQEKWEKEQLSSKQES